MEAPPTLKSLFATEQYEKAWNLLLHEAQTATTYPHVLRLCRWHGRLQAQAPRSSARPVKVALLGGATTETLEAPLRLALAVEGLDATIHRAPFNLFAQEMLDASSETVAFAPDVAVVVGTPANLPAWPEPGDSLERVNELVGAACDHWLGLCARLHEHTPCEIVLNNFHALPTRPLGNLEAKVPWAGNNFLRRLNLALGDGAPAYVHLNDVEGLAAQVGVRQWFDPRYWFHAKQPVSFECLPVYVRNTARIVGALYGRTSKCLVLDLDNTLWGGVIGDDGLDGIRIGEGNAEGEAFKAFQEYALQLKRRGILLAVCSKNEEANALAPFTDLPDMVLRRDDFLAFKANWNPKPDNLRAIAAELNIGTDALVFVDDNPAEREIVRQWLPEVRVIELTEDPADYPRLLDEAGCFEVTALSSEDLQRVAQYEGNAKRQALASTAGDYTAYLESLDQSAVIRPFEPHHLDRITQLINKSNQFNLTTLRLNRSQVEKRMHDPDVFTATVRVADRFGDNGLISVLSAERRGDDLFIETWLMSCRVLKRGVEHLLCNHLVADAHAAGVQYIHGVYLPTAKNGLVRDLYPTLGFAPATGTSTSLLPSALSNGQEGTAHWVLDVSAYEPFEVSIQRVDDY